MIISEEGNKKMMKFKENNSAMMDGNRIGNGTGCTANVVLMTKQKYIVANAGDSRSALYCQGQTITLSEDHKP